MDTGEGGGDPERAADDGLEAEVLKGELLALKAVLRWLVARELARSPDPHGAAQRLEGDLEAAIEFARFAHSPEALGAATASVQTMMALIDLTPGEP